MLVASLHKQRAAAFFLILLFGISVLLTAQDDNNPDIETDWDTFTGDLYVKGDQTITIALGTVFPLIFINNGKKIDNNINPPVGGSGLLAYSYYLNKTFFLGGEVGGMFLPTLGKNTLFMIPLGIRGGMHFIAGRFEFPISLSFGMIWHNYLNFGYYGFFSKANAGAFFRATSEWSFGISSQFGWYPEWTSDKKKNIDGYFLDILLSARYHF